MSTPTAGIFGPETALARFGRTLFTLLLCLHFMLAYMAESVFLRLPDYVAGHERLPYQNRELPMLLMRAAGHVHALTKVAAHLPFGDHTVPSLVMALLAFFGMLAAVYATRGTIQALTGDASLARWIALLVVLMSYFDLASTWGLNYTAPYDVPSLAFFALGIWLIVTGRLLGLYPVFLIATFNRETTIFLVLFYILWNSVGKKAKPSVIALNAIILTALWIAIKLYLAHRFQGNPMDGDNGLFASHARQNLKFLLPQQWPVLLSVCAFTLPIVIACRRWIRNPAYSAAAGGVMALWFLGMMVVGVLVELRIFAEWAALVTPFLALILHHRFSHEPAAA
ncbi:hypothetical protein SAMN05421771_0308 [Granulicella pectinivorans]|uniref:Uncharacterized protein n=1 Tax=Granulicella pectinivorans TaxID=474950 RepID=A0A1I6L5Y7_9BACT|nr:hypothetical protein [Granulicella pectinivorans]SFR98844.1 hypothetical protein SAMN05421771_0308 [Granulicella pectinivorans]